MASARVTTGVGFCHGDMWRPELPSQPYLGREEFEVPGEQGEAKIYMLCLETQKE